MKEFKIGDHVKRRSDCTIQIVYDIDEMSNSIKVNWLDRNDKMLRQVYNLADGDRTTWPIVKTKC